MVYMFGYSDLDKDGRIKRSFQALCKDRGCKLIIAKTSDVTSEDIVNFKLKTLSIFSFFLFFINCFSYLVKLKISKTKVVFFYLHDYYSHFLFPVIKLVFPSAKVVFDCHEIIIDSRNSIRERVFNFLESCFFNLYDVVITPNEKRKTLLRRYYKRHLPIIVIRNITENVCGNGFESEYVSNKPLRFVYQGVISRGRGLESIINYFKEIDGVHLTFIGYGADVSWLELEVESISNIDYIGSIDRSLLYSRLSSFDIGVISYISKDLNNKYCAPNKIYEYTSCGLFIISSSQVTIEKEIVESNIGVVADYNIGDASNKIVELSRMLNNKSDLTAFNNNNSWVEESKTYAELYYLV